MTLPSHNHPVQVKLRRYLPMLILSGLAVHLLLPQLTALQHSLQVLKQMAWWAIALAILCQIGSYLGSGYLIKSLTGISLRRATLVTLGSSSFGLVAGGVVGSGAATFRWLRASDVSSESAVLAGWLPIQINNLTMALVSIFGLVHLLLMHELTRLQAISFSLILALFGGLTVGFFWSLKHRQALIRLIQRLISRWARLRRKAADPETTAAGVGRFFDTWDQLVNGECKGPFAGALLNIGFDMATLFFVFVAAGSPVSPGILLTGYGLPLLLGKLTFLPGGVGVVEGTMTALYHGLGVPDAVTVTVILIYRLLSFWLPTLIGFPLIPYLDRKVKRHEQAQSV